MAIKPGAKIAAFCRELADGSLERPARDHDNVARALARARETFVAGRIGQELETELDELDRQLALATGDGLYPPLVRYSPLPGAESGDGARWWTCPHGWCAGRGRVRPGQDPPPTCGADGTPLAAGPFPE